MKSAMILGYEVYEDGRYSRNGKFAQNNGWRICIRYTGKNGRKSLLIPWGKFVYCAFHPEVDIFGDTKVYHKDGNKMNNSLENLTLDKKGLGVKKLNKKQCLEVKKLFVSGMDAMEIAKKYGIAETTVYKAIAMSLL